MRAKLFHPLLAAAMAAPAAPGCAEPMDHADGCAPIALDRAVLVLESDRSTSSALGMIDRGGCLHETADVSLGADPELSISAGRPFVGVRDQGVALEIDPRAGSITRSIAVFREGEPQPNPWDIAVDAEGRLWVARYDLASAGVIAQDGSWAGSVDLSSLADADGIPEMAAVTVSGGRAYIALERLKSGDGLWEPAGPGVIAVAKADPPFELSAPIELTGKNPFGRLVPALSDPSGDTVSVATPGDFDAIDEGSGVEVIHLASGAHEVVAAEADLGGSVIEAAIAGPHEGYAIVAGPVPGTNPTSVVRFDPGTGEVTRTLAGPASSFAHTGLALDGPYVLVGDRTYGAPGIHVFDRETGDRVASFTPKVLPPISFVTLEP